jgi:hypothetical protein
MQWLCCCIFLPHLAHMPHSLYRWNIFFVSCSLWCIFTWCDLKHVRMTSEGCALVKVRIVTWRHAEAPSHYVPSLDRGNSGPQLIQLCHYVCVHDHRVRQLNRHFTARRRAGRTAKPPPEEDCRITVLSVSIFQLLLLNKCFYSSNNALTLKPATISALP